MATTSGEMAQFRVLTINFACPDNKALENNTSRRSAIATLILEADPDIVLLQNVHKRRDVEFIDFILSKHWRHYNYYLKRARSSVAIMARAGLFDMKKVSFSDLNIVGTSEQKSMIQKNFALVRLTHKETKNFMFVGSWCVEQNVGLTDEKKKRLSSLLVSLLRKETVGAFWLLGGDFGVPHYQNSVHPAQVNQGEFFNLVEGTGRSACTEDNKYNYFVFSGMSGHRRMTFSDLETGKCREEKINHLLNCTPLSATVTITWAAASPRHIVLDSK